jgi:hypothetical protein
VATESESKRLSRDGSLPDGRIALFNLVQETPEHRLLIESAIVAKAIFIEIRLEIVLSDRVVNPTNSILNEAPKAFDGLCVRRPENIDASGVIDATMVITAYSQPVVRGEIVSKNCRFRKNMLANHRDKSVGLAIWSNNGADAALAFDHAKHGRFLFPRLAQTADGSAESAFVHLYLLTAAAKRRLVFFVQHTVNLFEHPPCGFVGHTRFALNLFCRDSAAGRGHEIDRIEPRGKRRWGFVKDRVSGRMNVIPAVLAAIGRAAHHAIMLCDLLTVLTKDAIWIQTVLEPFEARGIVGELFLKGFQRESLHFGFAVHIRSLPSLPKL